MLLRMLCPDVVDSGLALENTDCDDSGFKLVDVSACPWLRWSFGSGALKLVFRWMENLNDIAFQSQRKIASSAVRSSFFRLCGSLIGLDFTRKLKALV